MPESVTSDKVVILNFDDGRKTQYTQAKPILDKYGYKATFYVVCQYPDNKNQRNVFNDMELTQHLLHIHLIEGGIIKRW
ncbi:MAG: hypothetical protein E6L04_03770 [Thaumarchaeota archaeon]|nr:MAG: hypothetical protein E6L04_03770 [Nitrososphaerota archaeon]